MKAEAGDSILRPGESLMEAAATEGKEERGHLYEAAVFGTFLLPGGSRGV